VGSHAHIVLPQDVDGYNPVANPLFWGVTLRLSLWIQKIWGGVRVELEDFPSLDAPVMFAMNHSHYFDFLHARGAIDHQAGVRTASFVKYRAFQNRIEGAYMRRMGNIPLTSRGYLICADFAQIHGRKPDEKEYRVLREVVDGGAALPNQPVFQALVANNRKVLGSEFVAGQTGYRQAISDVYSKAMATTLAQAERVVSAGQSLQIYPEGLYSTRLSQGRIGAVQIAVALGIPVVPVGFSGMNDCFHDKALKAHSGGVLRLRFGKPYRIQRTELQGFRPFNFEDEVRHRSVLEEETHSLMCKINGLLDPSCQWGEDLQGNGLQGISRFFS